MRIGLLLHGLDRPLTGVTRVALELARALERDGSCDVVFLTTSRNGLLADLGREKTHYLPGCARVPGLIILGGPLVALAARRLKLDLVHDPVGVSPFTLGRTAGAYKRVLTIHDAITFRNPEGGSWSNNFLHRRYVPATLRNVDAVVTVSQHARADIHEVLKLGLDRISVVPNGVSELFRPVPRADAQAVASSHRLDRPYILHVGAAQPRKNVRVLLGAFRQLSARLPGHALALVGPGVSRDESLRRSVEALGLRESVELVGPVPEPDLPALYSAAELFVFPSLFEGFGLPVLEAMACGTPVVCSNATSLPEVAGDAALLIDARDEDALVEAMHTALSDESLAAALRLRGLERAQSFTWTKAARQTIAVYSRLLSA